MNMSQQSNVSALAQPFTFYSKSYNEPVLPSLITIEDLKNLYKILAKKSNEAADLELEQLSNKENMSEAFKELKNKLWVQVWGENNEYISGDHESIFEDERLPQKISRINFNSYNGYQIVTQNKMHNWFEVQFDFKKNQIFDFSKVNDANNRDNSYIAVQGVNETWVDGTHQAIKQFLSGKKLKRNFLYSNYIYDVLIYFIFLPLIFRAVYLLGLALPNMQTFLTIMINVYIFLGFLYLFRLLFNYARWLFPRVEMEGEGPFKQRTFFAMIILGIASTTVYDIVKTSTFYIRYFFGI